MSLHLFPQTQESIPEHFRLSEELAGQSSKNIHRQFLEQTLFVLPENDGEALRSSHILQILKAPHLIRSSQSWGATLDREPFLKMTLNSKIKNICIFEIPGPKEEQALSNQGFKLHIVDHHFYEDLDRSVVLSSIEQLSALIGWELSDVDKSIAINDRSYIPGLRAELGLDNAAIESIRLYDLQAQGNKLKDIQKSIEKARRLIPGIPKKDNLYILEKLKESHSIIKQEIALQHTSGVANILEYAKSKVGFSGSPKVAKLLMAVDFEQLGYAKGTYKKYLGGDAKHSMFFNFKAFQPPRLPAQALSFEDLVPGFVREELEALCSR